MVDTFQEMYSRDDIALVAYNSIDSPFYTQRYNHYNCIGVPTICGDGLSDVWPCTITTLTADYNAHNAVPSPVTITLSEDSYATFTAHIAAEETVSDAVFVMVAVEDDTVLAYFGNSHLPYHAREFMTPVLGESFSLGAGNSVDITRSFTVQPDWYYGKMGVVAWVQKDGGVNTSPSPDIPSKHQVLQAAFAPTSQTSVPHTGTSRVTLAALAPNPFRGESTISFRLPDRAGVEVSLFDVVGRLVQVLLDGELPGGAHEVTWDGTDRHGRDCSAGIYFARVSAAGFGEARGKLVKIN